MLTAMIDPSCSQHFLPPEIATGLVRLGVVAAGQHLEAVPLTGGVSSDIWKIAAGEKMFCVKRARAKLAVSDDWFAPVERNRFERSWYAIASERVPGVAPRVVAFDDDALFFVMEFFDPADFPLWKGQLSSGVVNTHFAGQVGSRLGAIHAATAGDAAVAELFKTDDLFEALRLDPYLRATGRRHPSLAPALNALADRTVATKKVLVHGDLSPKNILAGSDGPVILDAECAWYGDPAFDLAFCLNHFLLKSLWRPEFARALMATFREMHRAYIAGITWEPTEELEARAAALLPGLLLARVDGKSPVEYLVDQSDKDVVRGVAVPLIERPVSRLAAVQNAWMLALGLSGSD